MAELAQMTGDINTTTLSINSLWKGLTCCKDISCMGIFIFLCVIHLFICVLCLSLRLFSPWYARINVLERSALLAVSQPRHLQDSQNPETVSYVRFIMPLKKMR